MIDIKLLIKKYMEHIITLIVLFPVSLSFVLNPLTNDARIYQGVARLTDYFGTFPSNINNAWEIKPIANRGLNYIFYKLASIYTTFGSYEYEILIKIFSLILVLSICYYFSTKFNNKYLFLLMGVSFLSPLNFTLLQAEWWASLLAFLSITLFISDKHRNHYLSGAIVTIIFLFKGITLLLILPIIGTIYLLKKDWLVRLEYGLGGSINAVLFILSASFFKDVIPDLLLSAQIAHVGMIDIQSLLSYFLANTIVTLFHIPVIICGLVALSSLFIYYMSKREINKVVVIILMWLTTISIVVIQSEFFIYHYMVLIVPSIITIILIDTLKYENIIKISVLIMMVLFLLVTSHWSMGMQVENKFWEEKNSESVNILNNFSDIKYQDSILYLDPGDAPYYFQSNSSCRYICPLPFQRNSDTWDMSNTSAYKETYNCIMNYTGKYIITDAGNWSVRNTSDNKKVQNKLTTQYKKVYNKGWNIYERVFSYYNRSY